MLLRTEFGKTIGGYTHYAWTSPSSSYTKVSDPGCKAFIFSLNMKEKFVPQDSEYLIRQYPLWGPAFGDGDITITDSCNVHDSHNVNNNSCANFPKTYNCA